VDGALYGEGKSSVSITFAKDNSVLINRQPRLPDLIAQTDSSAKRQMAINEPEQLLQVRGKAEPAEYEAPPFLERNSLKDMMAEIVQEALEEQK